MGSSRDLEGGNGDLNAPLIVVHEEVKQEQQALHPRNNGGLWVLLLSTFVAVCGSFEQGSCAGYSAPAEFEILGELKLSRSQYSFFGSVLTVGGMIGAIASGSIADLVGRKGALRIAAFSCIGGWLSIYISMGSMLLNVGRLITGFAIGVISFVVPVFIAEISPKELRGALSTANQVFICLGMTVGYVLGAFLPWRRLALTGIVPGLVLQAGLYFIPESPRWLAKAGREKEFQAALRQLRGAHADISAEMAELSECVAIQQLLPKVTVLDLVEKKSMRALTIGAGLMIFQQFSGYNGIVFFSGEIFVLAGIPPNVGNILYGSLQIVMTAFGAALIDRAGRKPLLLISVYGTFLGSLLTGMAFLVKTHLVASQMVPMLALTGIMIFMACYSIGLGSIPWIVMSEVFPLNTQRIGGSMVALVNWSGAWVVSYSFGFLMEWSSHGTFFICAAVCVVAIVFIIHLVPETKGRTLQEIQDSMD